jgi:polysaccharide export outer membrane protein
MTKCIRFKTGQVYKLCLKLFLILGITCFFSSCYTVKTPSYFRNLNRDTTISTYVNKNLDLKIRKGDLLSVQVSSFDKDEDNLYNSNSTAELPTTTGALNNGSPLSGGLSQNITSQGPSGYPVDSLGNIHIHTLGIVHVEGMSLIELKTKLETGLTSYLKDPIIQVSFVNHHVTIIGNVAKPQVLDMPAQPLTILDAIALSGGVIPTNTKAEILVIRDSSSVKQINHINMEGGEVFNSSFYYVQPNDIVYVEPNFEQLDKQTNRSNFQQVVTVVATTLTLFFVILDRFTTK